MSKFTKLLISAMAIVLMGAATFRILTPGPQGSTKVWSYGVGASSALAIIPGMFVNIQSGYIISSAAADDTVFGVALSAASIPSSSGLQTVLVDTSLDTVHYFPADATADVVITRIGTLVDIASATEIDGNATTDDLFEVVGIDAIESQRDTTAGFYVRINGNERVSF